jgi:hypothetical protein
MAELLPVLGFTNHPTLNSSITDMRFVTDGQNRALVFAVSDSVSAFGTLLSWEKTLPSDLSLILELASIDVSGEFSDIRIQDTDVRVFTTTTGNQTLLYGFISGDTVVIANSPTLFTSLVGGI